jgi:enoyl-CoA hydratase/carnithine racemase
MGHGPSFEYLRVISSHGVVTVVMDRPPVNAVSLAMYGELYALFSDIDQVGDDVRAVVLTGAGRHFCAGNDLDDFETMAPENARVRMFHVREAFFAIRDCPVPVVGAVGGVAVGTGLALAASCDFVLAAEDAVFSLPEISVGVMGGAKHLSRFVPEPIVRWMFLTGKRVAAREFERWGGVIGVVERTALLDEAARIAQEIASFSPTAVRIGKRGLNDIEFLDTKRGYELEQGLTVRMSGHPDSKEALHAARHGGTVTYAPADSSAR